MKKALVCLSLVGLLAGTAMAEPMALDTYNEVTFPIGSQPDSRVVPYSSGIGEIYDQMPVNVGGPSVVEFAWTIPSFVWLMDDVNSMAGTTFTHNHMVMQNASGNTVGTTRTQLIGFFSNAGGQPGAPLLTTGGSPALFIYTSIAPITPGYATIYSFSHPTVVSPTGDMFMGSLNFQAHAYWGNATNGLATPGYSNATTAYVVSATSGGLPTTSPFLTTGNLNWAVGVPEPTTIAVLGLAGLLALRRRR